MHDNKLDISAPAGSGEEDVTTWALPEGATTRLGRGQIGKMEFSPDGTHLAVPTRIGCWLYDLGTMTHRALWGQNGGWLQPFHSLTMRDGLLPATGMVL